MMKSQKQLLTAWIVSLTATFGSLFASEVMKFIPCDLCWYQRILMYPMTILLGIAYFKKDALIYRYTLPLSIGGILVSGYHYYLQQFAPKDSSGFCTTGCTGKYIDWFGFVTIPFLSFIAFSILTTIGFSLRHIYKLKGGSNESK